MRKNDDIASDIIKKLKGGARWVRVEKLAEAGVSSVVKSLVGAYPGAQWLVVEELLNFENVSTFASNGSELAIVDALHFAGKESALPYLKAYLAAASDRPFVFLGNAAFNRLRIPEYLGEGCNLVASANTQVGDDTALLEHARLLSPKYTLDDLILAPRTRKKLGEGIDYIRTKAFCENEWGFKKRHSRGHGVTLVFHGPSGTGKTMAAEVVANTLKMPLYQIDLSSVVSKWVGETEKNLKTIFRSAEGVGGILLFDEGDAIFGSRGEVKGSQDRYANLEINYLLQELESFDGVVILSTNHENNMDDAFLRRFTYSLNFGNPGREQRKKIWKVNIPKEMPLGEDLDFEYLSQFSLSGGNIKNIIRDAAALASAEKKSCVSLYEFMWAMKRELQKHGRGLTREQLGETMWRLVGSEWEDEPLVKRIALSKMTKASAENQALN